MKTLFTFLAVACSFALFAANNNEVNSKITGAVIDSVTSKPVEFATVALVDAAGKTIDGTVCDENGKFAISKVAPGNYTIKITFVGFDTKEIPVKIDDKKDNTDLGKIIISPSAQVLREVTVEGEKAIIEERVDRTVYNAENDMTAKGGDATDVLKRVPMLSVDLDGNVSLRGSQNIMVLINNKPSTIVATSVADALKQIPADQIKQVEVITSPSAKYDAEGSAGIINIITKKNNLQGLTLNVDAGVGYRGSNLGLNGNYRKGKMGFSLGGFGRAMYNVTGSSENLQVTKQLDANGNEIGPSTTTLQTSDNLNQGLFGNYNLGWDYDINAKNTLAASVRFGVRNGINFQNDMYQYTNGNLVSLRDIESKDINNNIDASLTYTHLYARPSRELSFQGQYSRNNRDGLVENFAKDVNDFSTLNRFKNLNDSYNQEMTLQVDYQSPIGQTQIIEFGGKNIWRQAISDFSTYNATGATGSYVFSSNSSLSNNLNYDQNVTAGYLSYTVSTKSGYSMKAGSRYEYTTINAYTQTDDNIELPSYGVLVPSVNVSKRLKAGNMIKASYNRRIQRPSIRFLNPNIQSSNPLNITIGNPDLQPEFTNNYELSYSTFIKGTTINVSAFARNTNDAIQSLRDVIGNDPTDADTIRTQYANIGYENAYGMNIFANVNIGKLTLNGGGDVYYAKLSNNNDYWLYKAQNEGWVVSGRIFGSYNLDKGWGLQFFSFMRGNQVQLQGTQGGMYMYGLALRKEFNEKRGSIGLGTDNFFNRSLTIKSTTESPALSQENIRVMNNFNVRLTFSYRIGKMSMENRPRRSKRSINNDDLKEGGGDMGDMGGGNQQQTSGAVNMNQGARPTMPMQNQAQTKPADQPKVEKPADGNVYEAAGTWNYTIDSPQGGGGVIALAKGADGKYTGTIKSERMREAATFSSVVVNGNDVTLSYTMTFGANSAVVEIKATINNNDMNGTLAFGQMRTFNLTGKRSN
jgi:outer membrane receptor protein involved in Fe transport